MEENMGDSFMVMAIGGKTFVGFLTSTEIFIELEKWRQLV